MDSGTILEKVVVVSPKPFRGIELDPENDVRRRCNKNFSVLTCIDKRTREGCGCGSKVGTAHSGLDREGPVSLRKPKKSGGRENCKKDFVSR